MALNNAEAMLSGQEAEEEARILAALSALVAASSARIWDVSLPDFLLTIPVPCNQACCKPFLCTSDFPLKLTGNGLHAFSHLRPRSMHTTDSRGMMGYWHCADTQGNLQRWTSVLRGQGMRPGVVGAGRAFWRLERQPCMARLQV